MTPIIVCGNLSPSTPAQPYEEKRCAGDCALGLLRAQFFAVLGVRFQGKRSSFQGFNSPGCDSTLSRRPSFSRRQAVGVVAYLNTGTLTAVQFLGAILRLPRSLLSDALLQACKQSCSRVAQTLKSFSSVLRHGSHHERRNRTCPTQDGSDLTRSGSKAS